MFIVFPEDRARNESGIFPSAILERKSLPIGNRRLQSIAAEIFGLLL
jgi:hypothetical protein